MSKSMTSGNPLKLILMFALPLLLGNLFQQAYNMADAAIVGQTLGANALASVGATGSVQFLVLGFCMGVTNGFAIPIANAFGGNRFDEMRKSVFNGGVLIAVIALLMTVVTALSCSVILTVMKTPQEIFTDTYWYLLVIFLGIPFILLYNYLSAVLRAIGDSKTPFLFLAFSSVLNIILDFFCILVLQWGVAGAAIATVFAQGVSGILCLLLIKRKFEVLHLHHEDRVMDKEISMKLLNMGVPMGLQFSITAIGTMVMQAGNNELGTIYVSGVAAGMKIHNFVQCPFDALATAVCTFVSQNYGALKEDRVKNGIVIGCVCAVIYGIFGGIILILLGNKLSLLFLAKENVAQIGASAKYLKYVGFFYITLGMLYVTRLTTQGLGFSKKAILAGVFEMIARIIVTMSIPRFGFAAVCFCDCAAWIAADVYIIPTCVSALRYAVKEISEEKTYLEGKTA